MHWIWLALIIIIGIAFVASLVARVYERGMRSPTGVLPLFALLSLIGFTIWTIIVYVAVLILTANTISEWMPLILAWILTIIVVATILGGLLLNFWVFVYTLIGIATD